MILIDFFPDIQVTPISSSLNEDPADGEPVTITGWGKTGDADGAAVVLQYSDTPTILDYESCKKPFGSSVTENVVCIDATQGGICNGDSGGPLNYPQPDGSYIQVGITSFGPSTGCEQGLPSVFTRVSSYNDWILQTIGEA